MAVSSFGPEAFAGQAKSLGDRVVVLTWTVNGTMDGGPFELSLSYVAWGDDELRVCRAEAFDTTEEALARLTGLRAS